MFYHKCGKSHKHSIIFIASCNFLCFTCVANMLLSFFQGIFIHLFDEIHNVDIECQKGQRGSLRHMVHRLHMGINTTFIYWFSPQSFFEYSLHYDVWKGNLVSIHRILLFYPLMKYVVPCSISKSIMCPLDAWLYTRGMQMEKIDCLKLKKYIEMNFVMKKL